MPDKWQEINLRLDGDLAQALRDLKRGHDESLAEVVLRVLRKAVRQGPANRAMADARSGGKGGRGGRNAFAGARRGKLPAGEERRAPRGPARGKPFAPREVADGDTWAPSSREPKAARGAARPRPSRVFAGQAGQAGRAFRPQQGEGATERRGRGFSRGGRNGDDGGVFRPNQAGGGQRGGVRRARKVKGRRLGRG